jgi:hypothetical protein
MFDDPFQDFKKLEPIKVIDPGLEDPGFVIADPIKVIEEPGGGGLPGGGGTLPDPDRIGPSILNFIISPSSLSLAYGNSSTVTISAEVRDLESGILGVTFNGSNMPLKSGDTYQTTRSYLYNSSYAGTTRVETYSIIATDGAGNLSRSDKTFSVYYGTVPDTTRPSINSFVSNNNSVSLNNSTTSASITLTVNATDAGGISAVSVNNGASQVYQTGSNWYFSKSFSFSNYGWGSTTETFTATVTDNAGNNTTSTKSITINKSDTQSPVIASFSGPPSVNVSNGNQTVTYSVTATDNRGISGYSVNGATHTGTSGNTYSFQETFSQSSYFRRSWKFSNSKY